MALPQRHRLRGLRVFDAVYRRARRLHGSAIVLRVLPQEAGLLRPAERPDPPSLWRCAVVVSSKVSKRSVERNRLRRLLHQHLLDVPIQAAEPIWLLVSLKPGSSELSREQLLGECDTLLRKAGLTP